MKKVLMWIVGLGMVILGITLVLKWWFAVEIVFKGFIGMGLAVAGLFVMYLVKGK